MHAVQSLSAVVSLLTERVILIPPLRRIHIAQLVLQYVSLRMALSPAISGKLYGVVAKATIPVEVALTKLAPWVRVSLRPL
jgi:hypothetical protein